MDIKTYSTSDICKLCNMSRKRLRYYEERGLLKNVLRGDENNYRYYTEDHINEILLIKELLRIGFSLNEIIEMSLDSSLNGIQKTVKKRMQNAEEELRLSMMRYEQSTKKYVQLLEAITLLKLKLSNEDEEYKEHDYTIINYPSQYVVTLSYEGTFLDTERSFIQGLSKLYSIIEEYNITTLGSVISIYHDHYDSEKCVLDNLNHKIEICIPVLNMNKPCPYYKKIESFKGVSTNHIGSYDKNLDKTYINLLQWTKKNGYKLANFSVEDCLISPLLTRSDKYWVTGIMIPIVD